MRRAKAAKKSSMRGKRGGDGSRSMMRGRESDKKAAGEMTPRATSRARGAPIEKATVHTGRMAGKLGKVGKPGKPGKVGKAGKEGKPSKSIMGSKPIMGSKSIMGKRRPRKSDI